MLERKKAELLMGRVSKQRYSDDESRWRAVRQRDVDADGEFFFSVATTGVYCYPSCPARRPRRDNVAFHATRAAAERAGFRPCKRCLSHLPPKHERYGEAVARACRMLEDAACEPTLAQLAQAQGMSPHHFQRIFKEIAGITPKQYARAHRAQRMRSQLRSSRTVTEAMYEAGYGSSSRFYEHAQNTLGMGARAYARGGDKQVIRWSLADSWLGRVLVAATESGVCAILLGEDDEMLRADLTARFPNATLQMAEPGSDFSAWVRATLAYIDAPRGRFSLPLDVAGTAFQQRVWDALREVAAGQTTTYAELARRIGQPTAARAVAGACASNPLAVAIPCHRVLRSDGALSGYRWGVARKRALLEREAEA